MLALRERQHRPLAEAQRAAMRARPGAGRQRDHILGQREAHGPNHLTGTRLSAGMNEMIASQISSPTMNGRQAR